MKKTSLCLFFLSSLLTTACSFNNGKGEKTVRFYEDSPFEEEEEFEEEDSDIDYSYLFILDNSRKSFCCVQPKVKDYVDAMCNQRDNDDWANEDKINDLHGDTVKIKSYKGDYDKSAPVELAFEVDDSIRNEAFQIRCWVKGDKQNYKQVDANGGTASFDNLYRGTEYEWCVISSSGKKSGIGTFKTEEYLRILSCGDLFNVRDCGGWTTLDGKKIKQGLLYRGGEINDRRFDMQHDKNVYGDDDPAKEIFVKDLGIRQQIDLRNDIEAHDMIACPMNKEGVDSGNPYFVRYARLEIDSYANGLDTKIYQQNIKKFFEEYVAYIDERPIYCNCYGGADRTGTVCFLVGALLGMSYTDLIMDYEATTFSTNFKAHDVTEAYSKFPDMVASIKSWPFYDDKKPLKSIIETYLTDVCGVSKTTIEKIRNIMLEDPRS